MKWKPFTEHNKQYPTFKDTNIGLHGDVVIEKIDELPEDFNDLERDKENCLAYGEHTLHCHMLTDGEFDVRIDKENPRDRLFLIKTPTTLRHQEHGPVVIPPGKYKSRIQREYDPFSKRIREVAD